MKEVRVHQPHCNLASLFRSDCICLGSSRNDIHVMPNTEIHHCSDQCWCFPIPQERLEEGPLVWLHQRVE